jgi:SAM-dependent methyltransferase
VGGSTATRGGAQAVDAGAFRSFEQAGWDRVAGSYHRVWRPLTEQFIGPLLRAAGVGPGQRVLDLACGPGYVAAAAAALGAEVVGLDLSPEMVATALALHPRLEVRQGAAESLDFPGGSFDRVLMSFGVNHVADPEAVFREACRVLRPGGRLGFSVWAGSREDALSYVVEAALGAHALAAATVPEGPDVHAFTDAERCRESLAAAGFWPGTVRATLHRGHWRTATTAEVFEAERHHGVRIAALLACQPPERLERIRAAIEAGVAMYPAAGGYAVPLAAWVVVAERA